MSTEHPPVRVARTCRERSRGLLGRSSLQTGEALLIPHCRSVHTFGMQMPLTVVFLDARGTVLRVRRMPPGRIAFPRRGVRHILELGEGATIRPGEQVPLPPDLRLY